MWEVSGSGPGCQSEYRSVTYEAMTPQCGRSVVQVLVVRVNIGVGTYEAITLQFGRSVVQVLVVRVDIGVVTYEAFTPQCGRSVVQVIRRYQSGYRSGDLSTFDTPVEEINGSGSGCNSGYGSGDL